MISANYFVRQALVISFFLAVSLPVIFSQTKDTDYFGQTPPDSIPQVFATNSVSTNQYPEWSCTFNPTFTELYFTRFAGEGIIYKTEKNNEQWSEPQVTSFSTMDENTLPYITPDGSRLYFSSNKAFPGSQYPIPYHIWYLSMTETGWTEPQLLGEPFKSIQIVYPTVSSNGNMYFTGGNLIGGLTQIYVSKFRNGQYQTPELLDGTINQGYMEAQSFIAPDESFILFTAQGKMDCYGGSDLYISFRQSDNSWTEPVNVGPQINTDRDEICPYITPDGKYLFFSRDVNHDQNIFWVSTNFIDKLRPTTSIDGKEYSTPANFKLYQNFPNPFNPSTNIRFDVSEQSRVQIEVFNILGNSVKTLVDEVKSPGRFSIKWDGTNNYGHIVPSGLYFYRMKSGNLCQIQKAIFMK